MSSSNPSTKPQLAFLTVTGTEKGVFIGGLLVLNNFGRPLEFHCTAPVRPNRAQEILYGNTLAPFLCGEQIAPALLTRCDSPLLAVLTDTPSVLASALLTSPCLLLLPSVTDSTSTTCDASNAIPFVPGLKPSLFTTVTRGVRHLAVPTEFAAEPNSMSALDDFLFSIDPAEPFERIRLAIEEAQRGSQGSAS
ncbi:MAG: hypothetical protein Q4G68_03820 [Planctomycetia bacterium]|nr:hypothetical protein [Planctomycetia bacterium]